MNDFRFYDHVLSPREVAEIAKGLVLHYPLNKSVENILSNTNIDSVNYFGFSEQTGGSTKEVIYDNGIPCVKITRNSTAHSGWSYLWASSLQHSKIKTNTTYTVSFDAKGSAAGSIGFSGFMNDNATNQLSASVTTINGSFTADTWTHLVFQTTTKSSFDGLSVGGQCVYMACNFLTSTGVWLMTKNFKVEEGTKDTPWIPNPSDSAYTALGFNDGIEYDVSGYNHNGTKSGIISYTSDTPRYSVATNFVENASTVTIAPCFSYDQQIAEMSVSCWFKTNTLNGTAPNVFSLGENSFFRSRLGNETSIWYYIRVGSTQRSNTFAAGKTLTDNTWHLLVVTALNGVIKVYVDGALIGTGDHSATAKYLTCSNVGTTWHLAGYGANSENFIGSLSDFRIYATALTADQVKQLYEAPISLANNGTLFANEFNET